MLPMNMQRPPKMKFVILIKENPALPHGMQKAFMSNGVSWSYCRLPRMVVLVRYQIQVSGIFDWLQLVNNVIVW